MNMSQYRPKPSLSFTKRVKSTKSAERKASTITVYENYYGKEVTSKAGYQLCRFLSGIRVSMSNQKVISFTKLLPVWGDSIITDSIITDSRLAITGSGRETLCI